MERLLAHAREWIAANPLDPATRIGAMVDGIQMEQVLNYIAIGQQEGARLLLGGKRTHTESGGFYIEPTIFDEVTPEMRIFREEIFGPVLAVTGFDTLEEASPSATTPTTAWRRLSGRRISTRRSRAPAPCAPAPSSSTTGMGAT